MAKKSKLEVRSGCTLVRALRWLAEDDADGTRVRRKPGEVFELPVNRRAALGADLVEDVDPASVEEVKE